MTKDETNQNHDEAMSALIRENARLGAELKQTLNILKIVSGDRDNQMREEGAKKERERLFKVCWIDKHIKSVEESFQQSGPVCQSSCNVSEIILKTVKEHLDSVIMGESPCNEGSGSVSSYCAIRSLIENLENHPPIQETEEIKEHVNNEP